MEKVKSVSEQGLDTRSKIATIRLLIGLPGLSTSLEKRKLEPNSANTEASKAPAVGVRGRNTKPNRSILERRIAPKPSWRKDPVLNHTIAAQGMSSWSGVRWHTDKKGLYISNFFLQTCRGISERKESSGICGGTARLLPVLCHFTVAVQPKGHAGIKELLRYLLCHLAQEVKIEAQALKNPRDPTCSFAFPCT